MRLAESPPLTINGELHTRTGPIHTMTTLDAELSLRGTQDSQLRRRPRRQLRTHHEHDLCSSKFAVPFGTPPTTFLSVAFKSICCTVSTDAVGFSDAIMATTPATCGLEKDVPCK